VRGALDAPGGRDSDAAEIAFDWFCSTNQAMAAAQPEGGGLIGGDERGRLELITEHGTFVIGEGEPVRTWRTTRHEFLRTITGRRSVAQVQALDADGPPLEVVLFENDFFTPATADIVE
jgi:hypothetical protein